MNVKVLHPEWRYRPCKGKPCFVSELLVCVPFEDELSFFGLDGKKYGEPLYASLVCFAGPHLMAAFNLESMTVWSHSNRKLLCEGRVTCEGAEELTPCPWRKNTMCLRGPKQMVIINLNLCKGDLITQSKYTLEMKTLMFKKNENGKLEVSSIGEVSLVSHCWLPPGDKLLLQTDREGMVLVDALSLSCSGEVLRGHDKEIVRCMAAVEGNRLFAGFDSGSVQMVDISNSTWKVLEILDVRNVRWISLSPSMESILLTTVEGSVMHKNIDIGKNTDIVRKPLLESIGVCPVGDSYCAVVGRDGSLVIYNIHDGKQVGELMIEEDCESVAFSPLCSLVVLGTRSGSLHFISVVNSSSPKVLHCDQPFLSPVSSLVFDRRGKILVAGSAAMDSEHVHIFRGRPSFRLLVLVPMPGSIIDLTFNGEGTYLVSLVKSEDGSALLYRTHLPEDLLLCPTNYQANNFHIFTGNVTAQRLTGVSSDVLGFHPKFGFFYHCEEELRRLPAFRNPDEGEPRDQSSSICQIEGRLLKLRVSPDSLWIAFINESGSIVVCKVGEDVILTIESPVCSFMEFSLWGDGLLAGDKAGGISYFKLPPNVCEESVIPEWLYICDRESISAKHQLTRMEGHESFDNFKLNSSYELQEKCYVKKQLDVMIFLLNKLSLEQTDDFDLRDDETVLDDYVINDLNYKNLKRYFACGGPDIDEADGVDPVNEIISFSGSNVQNYPSLKKAEHPQKPEQSEFNFFCFGMKLKPVKERLTVVNDIIKYIEYKKFEFNRAFDKLYKTMDDSKEKVYDIYCEMRVLSRDLPSKIEKDLWLAYVQLFEKENSFPEIMTKSEPSSYTDESGVDSAKKNIEVLGKEASSLKTEFDSQVEHLYDEKRKCNVLIAILELTNCCVLIYTIAEKELKKYQDMINETMLSQAGFKSELSGILSDVEDLEKEYTQIYDKGFKLERVCESKVRMKVDSERFYRLYFLPPSTPVTNFQEALSSDLSMEKPFPIDDKVWDTICKNRDRRIKVEHFIKEVESETSELIDIKFRLQERLNVLEIRQHRFRLYLSGFSTLLRKLSYTVHKLLTVDFGCDRENIGLIILEKGCATLNSRLKEFEDMLYLMSCLVKKDCSLSLEPVEELTDRFETVRNALKESKKKLDVLDISKWNKMFRVPW